MEMRKKIRCSLQIKTFKDHKLFLKKKIHKEQKTSLQKKLLKAQVLSYKST